VELKTIHLPKSLKKLVIAPIGDIQWSGDKGPTAQNHLIRHIETVLALQTKDTGVFFCGLGDYIDFCSPSNRRRLIAADLYDTAREVISEKAMALNDEVFDRFLAPTKGMWLGLVEGHHFFEADGDTTDNHLAQKLGTTFLGTSAYIKIGPIVLYLHHGSGGGKLPGAPLNTMYHLAAGLEGADIYLMGHTTKLVTSRLSRPFPDWQAKPPTLTHRDIWLVNTGSFCRSNIVGHRHGTLPRGDYAEQGLMTPSPLAAPLISIDLTSSHNQIRVTI